MTIDLRAILGDMSAVKRGGFTGGIFTTFTLDLSFFEQLIIPKVNQANCSNIIIFADPNGYQGALELRASGVSGVGQDYLCIPVDCAGGGIQHTKLALLAGPTNGRLLLGSGNLTTHGFGRNLELFSHFEFEQDQNQDVLRYPFTVVWDFLKHLANDNRLTDFANQQLTLIGNSASWLNAPVEIPDDFRIWHNYEHPIWDQLLAWREELGFDGYPIELVQVISPYYDQDGDALRKIAQDVKANHVDLHLHKKSANFNGNNFLRHWEPSSTTLNVNEIHAKSARNMSIVRALHAKAIIAREKEGAWCISGSANMSRPGMTRAWRTGGNLEMVTFQWSPDATAFDYLLHDPILEIEPLSFDEVKDIEDEPSEQIPQRVYELTIRDATLRGNILQGSVSTLPANCPRQGMLNFLRSDLQVSVELQENAFIIQLPDVVNTADAIQLTFGNYITPYRWVDYIDLLLKRGARSYHGRVRSQLETIEGTQNLFLELMNFLWEHVDSSNVMNSEEQPSRHRTSSHHHTSDGITNDDERPNPEDFIVPESELVNRLARRLENQLPYDRSLWSLRDLLSIVLLRLTTPTQSNQESQETETRQAAHSDDELLVVRQVKARERLRSFLMDYCKRYGRRLADPNFVKSIGTAAIFENHATLGRVLLNFASVVEEFSQADFVSCTLWIWAPLVWPALLDIQGKPTLDILSSLSPDMGRFWNVAGLPTLGVIQFARAFGRPSNQQSEKQVQQYMLLRQLIGKIESKLGEASFRVSTSDMNDIFHGNIGENLVAAQKTIKSQIVFYTAVFDTLKNYGTPIEQKYSAFLKLQSLLKADNPDKNEQQRLIQEITSAGMSQFLQGLLNRNILLLSSKGDLKYCPRCSGQLTGQASSELKRGNIVECTIYHDALIYHTPDMPEKWVW